MKYLVTGGAGFIGSHLVERLVRDGHQVRVLDDFSTGRRENLAQVADSQRLDIRRGDVRLADDVRRAVQGMDGVFHLAALVSVQLSLEDPPRSFDINVRGAMNVLETARTAQVQRVVLASSAAVYGDTAGPAREEGTPTNPLSPYALDKLVAEQYAALYSRLYGVATVALRYFNVYGSRQDPASPYSGVISVFADRIRQRREVAVYGDGEQTRDFVHVSDVVQANMAAMTAPYTGFAVCNVGTGRAVSINRLLETLSRQVGWQPPVEHRPARAGDIRHSCAEIGRARTLLGYAPQRDLDAGLRELVTTA